MLGTKILILQLKKIKIDEQTFNEEGIEFG